MKWLDRLVAERVDIEIRQGNFTDAIVEGILQRAEGISQAVPSQTGALEIAAGFIGRAFASTSVQSDSTVWNAALTPQLLQMMGRSLTRHGEFVGVIETSQGMATLLPANEWEVKGRAHPRTWEYSVNLPTPSGSKERESFMYESVIHIRMNASPTQPWLGLSPLQVATAAGRLSAEAANLVADELSTPRGYLLPVPGKDGGSKAVSELKSTLNLLKGKLATIETQQSMAADQGLNRRQEWETRRIGATLPEQNVNAWIHSTMEVLGACGIPRGLFERSDGAGLRESWRVFLFGTLAPLGRLVEQELSDKLETEITLNWDELRASDLSGRARAFQSLVGGGMDIAQAASLSGLVESE